MGWLHDSFWAEFLGIEPEDWQTPGISYRSHVGLSGYRGFWCFRRNERVVVSAPPRWVERVRVLLAGFGPLKIMDPTSLAEALGADVERAIGPAFQGSLEPKRFSPGRAPQVRRVTPDDRAAVAAFRAECGIAEWDDSGLENAELWRQAYFEHDAVTAMAGFRPWRGRAGGPCVLTHPAYRGRGHGAAVVRAVVAEALSNGLLLLYQTLEANQPSVRLAFSLGYERYANHVAIRLKHGLPPP